MQKVDKIHRLNVAGQKIQRSQALKYRVRKQKGKIKGGRCINTAKVKIMANITKKSINGVEFTFINHSRGNRSGFVHETELFCNNYLIGTNKAQYYNRTWECYTYQSVMKGCVAKMLENLKESFVTAWKNANEVKRLTARKKEQMEKDFAENPPADYTELKALYNSL